MARFRRMKTLQKFTSVHASVYNHFSQALLVGLSTLVVARTRSAAP